MLQLKQKIGTAREDGHSSPLSSLRFLATAAARMPLAQVSQMVLSEGLPQTLHTRPQLLGSLPVRAEVGIGLDLVPF